MSNDTYPSGGMAGRSPEYDDGMTTKGQGASGVPSTGSDELTSDETNQMISADKVQGTAVYDGSGERIGTIDSLMLNKMSGKVAYAVMSFGGFLGIGERYHPLPWDVLTYDEEKGGYNVQQSADSLRAAPSYDRDELSGGRYGSDVDNYYGNRSTESSTLPTSGLGSTGRSL